MGPGKETWAQVRPSTTGWKPRDSGTRPWVRGGSNGEEFQCDLDGEEGSEGRKGEENLGCLVTSPTGRPIGHVICIMYKGWSVGVRVVPDGVGAIPRCILEELWTREA